MLGWLSFFKSSSTPSVPHLPPPSHSQYQGNSTENNTPATSTASSPPPNVSQEYDLAVQAPSYNEIRSMIQAPPQDHVHQLEPDDDHAHHRHVLSHALQPDRESVREALSNAAEIHRGGTLTRLVSSYFDHSESTCDLCLLLHRSLRRARDIYAPLFDLIGVLPDDPSFSQHLCDRAFDLFVQFDCNENPFLLPHSPNFTTLRANYTDLKLQIEHLRRSHTKIHRSTATCMFCLAVTAVGAAVSGVLIAVHAAVGFTAVAAAPIINACLPRPKRTKRKEVARARQLEAASKGTFVVNDLDTIDSLVDRLQSAVEGDKALVRFALERDRERHPVQEVLKQLRKNQQSFEQQLKDLEEHIYLCFNAVNKARLSLLQEICLYRDL